VLPRAWPARALILKSAELDSEGVGRDVLQTEVL
jgi:hypothetical protein